MTKRTLDTFFAPATPKKARVGYGSAGAQSPEQTVMEGQIDRNNAPSTIHKNYPFAIPQLPSEMRSALEYAPASDGQYINNRPKLDLVYYEPFIDRKVAKSLFDFLRRELFYYRVQYMIKRGSIETQINTPRFTSVFGVDETSGWGQRQDNDVGDLLETSSGRPVDSKKYSCPVRPIPECLECLRNATEAMTGEKFNFCLVNYYADGNDSISYHSDDERFLGKDPAIASFSLGDRRDFLMKPKSTTKPPSSESVSANPADTIEKPLKLALGPGDMVLMRGLTQANWLHSIPKRKGAKGPSGRINITFRRAMVKGGTENYYQYNVGTGKPYRWNDRSQAMEQLENL